MGNILENVLWAFDCDEMTDKEEFSQKVKNIKKKLQEQVKIGFRIK